MYICTQKNDAKLEAPLQSEVMEYAAERRQVVCPAAVQHNKKELYVIECILRLETPRSHTAVYQVYMYVHGTVMKTLRVFARKKKRVYLGLL